VVEARGFRLPAVWFSYREFTMSEQYFGDFAMPTAVPDAGRFNPW